MNTKIFPISHVLSFFVLFSAGPGCVFAFSANVIGTRAKQFTSEKVFGKMVEVVPMDEAPTPPWDFRRHRVQPLIKKRHVTGCPAAFRKCASIAKHKLA